MRLQVLVSTMHQTDYSLLDKMNIQSDAVVINQCDKNCFEEFEYKGYNIKWYSLAERGVGLSRNTALQRADADILLFADDDVTYHDGYVDKVLAFFENNSDISIATFNIESQNIQRPEHIDKKDHKIGKFNCLKYGACKIAIKRTAVISSGVTFSLLFGGGAKYQAGEDNLFMTQCLKRGLRARASANIIGTVKQEESTWFKGYTEKYYMDRGSLFRAMYGKFARLMLLAFEVKNIMRKNNFTLMKRLKLSSNGIRDFDLYKRGINNHDKYKNDSNIVCKTKKYHVGYTAGVFDTFHIGHLNLLKNAKEMCDYLIVGVSTDEVVEQNKHKKTIIPFENRIKIVEAIKYVNKVIPQKAYDVEGKISTAVYNKIDVMFVGDDWKGTEKWDTIEQKLNELGIDVVYLPHTDGISSTILREQIGR